MMKLLYLTCLLSMLIQLSNSAHMEKSITWVDEELQKNKGLDKLLDLLTHSTSLSISLFKMKNESGKAGDYERHLGRYDGVVLFFDEEPRVIFDSCAVETPSEGAKVGNLTIFYKTLEHAEIKPIHEFLFPIFDRLEARRDLETMLLADQQNLKDCRTWIVRAVDALQANYQE